MNAAFLSLGGNLGNRAEHLEAAIKAIESRCGHVTAQSSVYETEAWGSSSTKKYLNQVLELETRLEPEPLLQALQAIELDAGRVRQGHQYSDRIMDIDILFFNTVVIHRNGLQLPHPRLHLRKFVLVPLAEIAPQLVHPELKKTINDLLKNCTDPLEVTQYRP